MPWSYPDNVPSCAKNWSAEERQRCTKAANAVLRDGGEEKEAIYACIHAAGRTEHPGGKKMTTTESISAGDQELEDGDREAARKAQEARARKYGIQPHEGGNVTKPSEWAGVTDEDWGDPVNYAYPCPDAKQTRAALSYWGKPKNKGQYSEKEQGVITGRLDRLAKKFKVGEREEEEPQEARPTDLRSLLMLDTAQGVPTALPIHIIGKWDHPQYGQFEFTREMGEQAIANFQNRVYRPNAPVTAQVVVDEQHAGGEANGWLESMFWNGQLLMGGVSWTERGQKMVTDRRYRFISPAYCEDYEGKGVTFKEVTLTNRNFLKELPAIDQPVLLSEDVARGAFLTPVSLSLREGGKGMDEKVEKKVPGEGQKKEAEGAVQATPGQVQLSEDQLKSLQEQAGRAKELEKRLAVLEREAKGREIEAAVKAAGDRGVDAFTLNFVKGLLMQLPRDGNQDMELEQKDAAPQKANGYQALMYFMQHVPGVVPTGERTKALDKPPAGEEPIDKGKAKKLAEAVSDSLPDDKEE